MPTIYTQPKYLGDWLKGEIEIPQYFSRDQITLLGATGTASVLTNGMVLGKISASGKYVQLAPAASDGSQNAAGLLVQDTTIPVGIDTQASAIVRSAVIMDIGITWPAGISGGQIATAIGQLQSAGVLTRRGA